MALSVLIAQYPARIVCFASLNFQIGGFNSTYAIITAFMWFATALLSPQYFKDHNHKLSRYYFFFLVTMGATLGVFLSADLMTTFIFFEIMSFTSYMWVIQDETKDAMDAGKTYLACALGMAANRNFYNTKYIRLPDLLVELAMARGDGTYREYMKKLKKTKLTESVAWKTLDVDTESLLHLQCQ